MNGTITQRSKGSWRIKFSLPANGEGRRKYFGETVRGTKAEAQSILRDRIKSVEMGEYVEKEKETVTEFMARWMATYAATNTTAKTQQGYSGVISRYINPALGNVRLQNLTAQQIQALYAEMQGRGLSATSVVAVHRVLKQALGHAVKWNMITRNVADATSPPRIQRKTMAMWDVANINRFLDSAFDDRFYTRLFFGSIDRVTPK